MLVEEIRERCILQGFPPPSWVYIDTTKPIKEYITLHVDVESLRREQEILKLNKRLGNC